MSAVSVLEELHDGQNAAPSPGQVVAAVKRKGVVDGSVEVGDGDAVAEAARTEIRSIDLWNEVIQSFSRMPTPQQEIVKEVSWLQLGPRAFGVNRQKGVAAGLENAFDFHDPGFFEIIDVRKD